MLEHVELRLKNATLHNKKLFQKVLTAVDEELVVSNGTLKSDAAFVIATGETSAGPDDTTVIHSQQINFNFAVIIAVRSLNDKLGSNVNARLKTIKEETRKQLLGWTPDAHEFNEISFVRAEAISFVNGGLFWLEEYTTDYLYRSDQQ